MAISSSASTTKKRKSKAGSLTLDEVKSLGRELLSSRAPSPPPPGLRPARPRPRGADLAPVLPSIPCAAAAAARDSSSDPELVFRSWLRQRFDELAVSPHSDDAIRDVAVRQSLWISWRLVKDGRFHSAIYHKFLHAVVHATYSIDPSLELLGPKYLKYADVCYVVNYLELVAVLTCLDKIANSLGSKTTGSGKDGLQNRDDRSEDRGVIFIHKIYDILAHIPAMDFQKESKFLA